MNWIRARAAELSTKIGLVLGALNVAIQQYVSVNPKLSYAGLIVAALLVIWPEKKADA